MNSTNSPLPPPTSTAEAQPKRSRPTARIAAIAGLASLGIAPLVVWLFGSGPISFSFALDGKPLTSSVEPQVAINGKPYAAALEFRPGAHSLAVTLPNAEPLNRRVWIVWGKRDLGALSLSSLKGGLKIDVTPSPATIALRQGTNKLLDGKAPAILKDIPVGSYVVEVTRGDYSEYQSVEIAVGKVTELNLALKIGSLDLSATTTDVEYEVSGKGRTWQGKLPKKIEDVPVGDYALRTRHKGWELNADLAVRQGVNLAHRVEYPYGSMVVETEPGRFAISKDGTAVGSAPLTLGEVRPGRYTLSANDGENELVAEIDVEPKAAARHVFVFRYGAVQLDSMPAGVAVLHRGKEVGKTPMKLEKVLVGTTELELRLPGYESTRMPVRIGANETAKLSARLFREEYVRAMRSARTALEVAQFSEARAFVATALEAEPNEAAALKLRDDVTQAAATAAAAARTADANAKAEAIARLPWLNFQAIIAQCTDSQEVKYPVELATGYYQEYIDEKDKKKKQRFVQTGTRTEIRTRTDYTFNWDRFNEAHRGKIFRFNCPDKWNVAKLEKDGSIILKGGGAGADEIKVAPSSSEPGMFSRVQKGQKITIRGVLVKYEPGGLFTPKSLHIANAEILANEGPP